MVVPVAIVSPVPVTVVHVIHVVTVRHRHMPAAFAVRMGVTRVLTVFAGLALVRVSLVVAVQMTVVHVVDVIAVRNCHMPAALAVAVVVFRMRLVFQGCRHAAHLRPKSVYLRKIATEETHRQKIPRCRRNSVTVFTAHS